MPDSSSISPNEIESQGLPSYAPKRGDVSDRERGISSFPTEPMSVITMPLFHAENFHLITEKKLYGVIRTARLLACGRGGSGEGNLPSRSLGPSVHHHHQTPRKSSHFLPSSGKITLASAMKTVVLSPALLLQRRMWRTGWVDGPCSCPVATNAGGRCSQARLGAECQLSWS